MNSIHRLLQQELDCFKEILHETETFYAQFDSYSQDSLINLLDSRQRWIDTIIKLEAEQKDIIGVRTDTDIDLLHQNIAKLTRTLIVIDARLLDLLQTVKSTYINSMAGIVPRQNSVDQLKSARLNKPQLVDIIQE